jgi:hypothetical protein
LCCVFESFQKKEFDVIPLTQEEYIGDFFREKREIYTNPEWADRVQKGIVKKNRQRKSYGLFSSVPFGRPRSLAVHCTYNAGYF